MLKDNQDVLGIPKFIHIALTYSSSHFVSQDLMKKERLLSTFIIDENTRVQRAVTQRVLRLEFETIVRLQT